MDNASLTIEKIAPVAPAATGTPDVLGPTDTFVRRHIGPRGAEIQEMLRALGCDSLDELIEQTIPAAIRIKKPLNIGDPRGEFELLEDLRKIAVKNKVFRSYIGMGYSDTITPPVILRNILENPGWYTQYTPYQAEISQGRLEALLNFQTMVADLTALPLANASLLDEATAAAEAMAMCHAIAGPQSKRDAFFVSIDCHPQTIAVVQTRAASLGIDVMVGDAKTADFSAQRLCGVLLQYPTSDGRVIEYSETIKRIHSSGALAVVAADILALALLKPPGEMGADIAVGSTQRFGVPMGFGGPHAAYMATRNEHARKMPGRLVGVSKDSQGRLAYRLAIQTREQHIRREKATSNICTAQVLLAIMASMYAVYHGPRNLRRIAQHVATMTNLLADKLRRLGHNVGQQPAFDTLRVHLREGMNTKQVFDRALKLQMNFRRFDDGSIGISLDETTTVSNLINILSAFGGADATPAEDWDASWEYPSDLARTSEYLTHPVFNRYHSETEMLRYISTLQSRDLSLAQSMIPLGSCTMKLNATSEMLPVTSPEFARLHPFAPPDQTKGYWKLFKDLEKWLANITGFSAVSLQPNAGSQGEYAGLLVIRAYHESREQGHRNVCLIPTSAHGTNPASAVFAGMNVVPVACDANGSIELADLKSKAAEHKEDLAALMITYPSTHGVFEEDVKEICKIVHAHGGLVYMDGANMNAQVGLCRPGDIGADVCHLNLHKTFCIPHGGGGPGMGPIGVAKHLAPFLPSHPVIRPESAGDKPIGAVSAAPYGSPAILTIPWVYIALMGGPGLTRASQVAILNANYMAQRLAPHYPVLFKGKNGRVAHEFVLDCRQFEHSAGIKVEDIAKRLMDYGFHAPTMSWPVPGTLMVEPTESESKTELDRFCDAMIAIRDEIRAIEEGKADRADNVLKNAPHSAQMIASDQWPHPYGRQQAAYPAPWVKEHKFWPYVGRIDNPFGDRNLVCTCPPMSAY
jgi:glycine dehydrogenase